MTTPIVVCLCIVVIISLHNTMGSKANKKYLIEVQDHQQAMKLADPISDLEETVRRGINDPLADPKFVMNRINKDYFHLPLMSSTFENKELLSLRQGNNFASTLLNNYNSNHLPTSNKRYVPSNPSQQQAVKDGNVPRIPTAAMFRQQQQQEQEQLQQQYLLKSFSSSQRQKLLQLARIISANRRGFRRQQNARIPTKKSLPIAPSRFSIQKPQQVRASSRSYFNTVDTINPLTGLPVDLEDNSFGAVSSITAVSDNNNNNRKQAATVTVNLNDAGNKVKNEQQGLTASSLNSQRKATDQSEISYQQQQQQSQTVPEVSKLLTSDQNVLETNFGSLKSFLEADTILRDKLSKDGLVNESSHSILQRRNKVMKKHIRS